MPLLKRRKVFAAKTESTIGTAETLTASEAQYNVYNLMVQPNIPMEKRESQGSFANLAQVPGGRQGTATFRTDLCWDGTSTEPKWASVLLPACGYVDNGSGVFTPRSEAPGSNVKTLTIAEYVDGKRRLLTGCMGDFRFVFPTGRMGYVEWTFQGVWAGETDATILTPTYPSDTPIRIASCPAASWDSVSLIFEQCVIESGNEITMRESPATASGYINAIVTARSPRATCNPEAYLVATQDRLGLWTSQGYATFAITLDGSSTSTIGFSAPRAQIVNAPQGDRNSLVTDELEFAFNRDGSTADTDLSITFTPTS